MPYRTDVTRYLSIAASLAVISGCSGEGERPATGKGAERAPEGAAKSAAAVSAAPGATNAPGGERPAGEKPGPAGADLPRGLLIAYAQFEIGSGGEATATPGPARLEILTRRGGEWRTEVLEDRQSNVMHKAMLYRPIKGRPAILALDGTAATVKLWRRAAAGWESETLWSEDFGGRFNRMRDGEVADLYGDGMPSIAVGTHDQGVVAAIRPDAKGGYKVIKLGSRPNTFIHEIEIGDLDGDKTLEVYATPSDPNRLDAAEQKGTVIRYVPKLGRGPEVVADLGNRHAKEILVGDVDGDGRDELYAAVEALAATTGSAVEIVKPVEIRRYDHGTPPAGGEVVATLDDRLCRFLTAGDIDGDGRKEMIAAAFRSGVWLLRPPAKGANEPWQVTSVDRESSGFEHAALLADLDQDGRDELYVAADEQGELRRYLWKDGRPERETIHRRAVPGAMMTWNIMPFTVADLAAP